MPSDIANLVIPVSALAAAGGAVYRTGVIHGEMTSHKHETNKRLDRVESAQQGAVTRGELEARFTAINEKLDLLLAMMREGK